MSIDRNAPCPCGSGRKFKKCHGAAVPPEAAALPAPERERLKRAVQLLERDRRVHQELLDWCDRKLGAEWANAALDQFAGSAEQDLSEFDEPFYAHWLLHHRPAATGAPTPALQWLEAQRTRHGVRMDQDVDALVTALRDSRIGLWRVTQVEPGVGYGLHDLLTGTTAFVYDDAGILGDHPDDVCLAYLFTLDDIQLMLGTYLDLLPLDQAEHVADAIRALAGVGTPDSDDPTGTISNTRAPAARTRASTHPTRVPREFLTDPLQHVVMRNAWHGQATAYWDDPDDDSRAGYGSDPDAQHLHDGILGDTTENTGEPT